ncbi:hypothetical protein CJ178_30980 [Rhodococcus sp. ACPA4]|uniref:hypothetical protein n=1 Tax=Rhodococcus sp. ACPA4 TaxID=2028571 RepID=UPI000BB0EB35|nr:hypothetical protein [Rhodococcus sp. ACPA4]PBC35872.1 hypothetical protein CJ178_30980 [Rhodococcus sp. ACPA4]
MSGQPRRGRGQRRSPAFLLMCIERTEINLHRLARLPDGVDTGAVEATIGAIDDRTETPVLRVPWRGATARDRTSDDVDQQGVRERLANDRNG